MAHIRRHPKTGKWQVRYIDPWKKERSATFDRKVDAEAFKAEVVVTVNQGDYIDPKRGSLTVGEWSESWLSGRVGVRASTLARDRSYIANHIAPHLGPVPLNQIEFEQVQEWVSLLEAKGLAPATIRKAHQLLSQMLDLAVRARRIRWNPATGVDLPTERSNNKRRFLQADEVGELANAIDPQYRALILLGAYTGLRWGEAVGLTDQRLNTLSGTLTVDQALHEVSGNLWLGPPKTPGSIRQIALPRFLADELRTHLLTWSPQANRLVFSSPEGTPLRRSNFRRRFWVPAVEKAGLEPMRFQDLRHTHAALLIAQGEHAKVIADRLGHSSPVVTMTTYAHLFPGLDAQAADRLNALHSPGDVDLRRTPDGPRPSSAR